MVLGLPSHVMRRQAYPLAWGGPQLRRRDMHGWWIAMGLLVAACLALVPNYNRHRQRRVQVRRVRTELATWLSAPTDSGGGVPPTFPSAPISHRLMRRTVMFGDLGPDITVRPRSTA